jgi:Fic family protein
MKNEKIQISHELLILLSEIDEFNGGWRAMAPLAPERLKVLREAAMVEAIASAARIEGSELTGRDIERVLAKPIVKYSASRDEQEVAAYAEALETIFQAWGDISISENQLRQLHRDLLRSDATDKRRPGQYKTQPNHVGAFDESGHKVLFFLETVPPEETPERMAELISWLNETRRLRSLHPLLIAAVFKAVFLEIHPFSEGNGRLSRVLTTLLLLQGGYGFVPYISLESAIEQSKDNYYLALRQTQGTIRQTTPNWQPWLLFFFRAMVQQVGQLGQIIEREKRSFSTLPQLAVNILDCARSHGRVGMSQMMDLTGASRNTLKEHFRKLVENRLLVQQGGGRSTWYHLA